MARARAEPPEVLLADDPTTELVSEQRRAILDLLLARSRERRVSAR